MRGLLPTIQASIGPIAGRSFARAHVWPQHIRNFFFRNGGMLPPLRATVEDSLAADSLGDGFVALDGARVTVRDSAALRNAD